MTSRRRMLAGENLTSKGVSASGEILDDWEQIVKICNAGQAENFYSIGNWKNVPYGSTNLKTAIGGFNVDLRTDGKGFANTSWIGLEWIDVANSVGVIYSWEGSLPQSVLETTFAALPVKLKNNIKAVYKNFFAGKTVQVDRGSSEKNTYVMDNILRSEFKIWTLSFSELEQSNLIGGYNELTSTSEFLGSLPYAYVDFRKLLLRGNTCYAIISGRVFQQNTVFGKDSQGNPIYFPFTSDMSEADKKKLMFAVLPCFCL